jgi:hypothetical protein
MTTKYKIKKKCTLKHKKKNTLGFIILRHVNSELTDKYWKLAYDSIRKFYPENKIVIIDDNSDFVTQKKMYKTILIQSEFPKRGELLPYYYYAKHKWFDTAVILHDSVFIQEKIDFKVDKYKFIWSFDSHYCDNVKQETKLIKLFQDEDLYTFYKNTRNWDGCFGMMSIITHDFLTYINCKYNLSLLLDYIDSRKQRMCLERVIACIFQKEYKMTSLLGTIHNYCPWGIKYENRENFKHLPILKVWTGR